MADVKARGGWHTPERNLSAEFRAVWHRAPSAAETAALRSLAERNRRVFLAFEGSRSPSRNDERTFNTAQNLASFYVRHRRGPDGGPPDQGRLGGPETTALINASTSAVPPASNLFKSIVHAATHPAEVLNAVEHAVTHPLATVKTVGHAVQAAAKAAAPVLDIMAAGASLVPIPGVAQIVASGLAATAEVGRGHSLADVGLAAARGAIPGGPLVRAGFDLGVGLARGGSLSSAALNAARRQIPGGAVSQAAFSVGLKVAGGGNLGAAVSNEAIARVRDAIPAGPARAIALRAFDAGVHVAAQARTPASPAALAKARASIVNPEARAAFDAAITVASRTHAPKIDDVANHAARLAPAARAVFAKAVLAHAEAGKASPKVQAAAHAVARSRARARTLSPRARSWVTSAVHRVAANLRPETRGLDPGGRTYTVEPNDSAWRIAQNLTGDGNAHYREIIAANSPPKRVTSLDGPPRVLRSGERIRTGENFQYLKPGEKLQVPSTWKIKGPLPPVAPVAPPSAAPIAMPVSAGAPVKPPAPAPASGSKIHEVTVRAGETWRLVWSLNRDISTAEAETLRTKLTAAMVHTGDTLQDWHREGRAGSMVIRYGSDAIVNVGMSAAVSVTPGAPIVSMNDAVLLTAAAAPVVTQVSIPEAPKPASAAVSVTSDDPAAVAQAKVILVAWEHTDGVAAAGLPDYGSGAGDSSPIWTARDTLELQAFCAWTNAHGGSLPLVGDLTQQKLDALVAWSEAKAKGAAPGGALVVSAPVTAPVQAPAGGTAPAAATETVPETSITATPGVTEAGMGGGNMGVLLVLGLGAALLLSSKKKVSRKAAA